MAGLALALSLSACSPRHDWREVRGTDAPFVVLMPAKPASHSRPVNIGGTTVVMTMTAAEVNGVTFAVGSAVFPDAAQAQAALAAVKTALINNIGGTVINEQAASDATPPTVSISIEAAGPGGNGQRRLFARLVAREQRVYQVLAVGSAKAIEREAVDMFLDSFKPS
jgi:hypothetical protein